MKDIHNTLYNAEQARALDLAALEVDGLEDGELMERAGEAAFQLLRFRWPRAQMVTVVCGPGNNGGDGYVIARKLLQVGMTVNVINLAELENQAGDALRAREQYQDTGGKLSGYAGGDLPVSDLVVDALLGIGVERPLADRFLEVVEAINRQAAPVLAIDIPTGVQSDTGGILNNAVRAQATISFIGMKTGLVTGAALDYVGDIYFDDLGVSSRARKRVSSQVFRLTQKHESSCCPIRKRDSHKGDHGRLLIVGGDVAMTGAVFMAGDAGMRCGAGLVRLAVHTDAEISQGYAPELMLNRIQQSSQLEKLLAASNVVILGPGLGRHDWSTSVFAFVLDHRKSNQRLVIDADGLNCLADEPVSVSGSVLTPHPGEAASLLACSSGEIQADRYKAANAIAQKYKSICVLKGAGTIISDGKTSFVCDRGHPAMASAGVGDVLAGVIGGLLGQGLMPLQAARLGVLVHAIAGELGAAKFGLGLKATDVIGLLPSAMQRVCPCPL